MKDDNKLQYFESNNLKERIEYIHTKYKDIVKFKDNMSMPLIFYEIPNISNWEYSSKSIIIMLLICIIFLFLGKCGIIQK